MNEPSKTDAAATEGCARATGCGAAPHRVRRSRKKGSRLPENTVVVSRPSKWGNPFKLGGFVPGLGTLHTMADVVAAYRQDLIRRLQQDTSSGCYLRVAMEIELRGKNLACWCALDHPCHADVLLRLANPDDEHHNNQL